MSHLEEKSIYVIREAYSKFDRIAALWSTGKDSTVLLWLCRKAFFDETPFPVIHIDTGFKFSEMYSFRDRIAREWELDLIITKNEEALKSGMNPRCGRFKCCNTLKTETLKRCIKEYKFDAILLGIRRDEHGVRNKERFFSPRDANFNWDIWEQPLEAWDIYTIDEEADHYRVHPILHWTEIDVWRYIKKEGLPVNPLYFAKDHKRFRSLGCKPCTSPIDSDAKTIDEIIKEVENSNTRERYGRVQDKENLMERLRVLGYM
ncbi:MAG: sulfate adenylyltransferase [Chloroflexi bacterium]|nr:MAG: sulfate adenylyltransferase [Chloroflexota bacterium]